MLDEYKELMSEAAVYLEMLAQTIKNDLVPMLETPGFGSVEDLQISFKVSCYFDIRCSIRRPIVSEALEGFFAESFKACKSF